MTWSAYTQSDRITWHCLRKLKCDLECIHTRWPSHMPLFQKAETWLGVRTCKNIQSLDIVSENWNMQEHPIIWHCFRKLKCDLEYIHPRRPSHVTLFQEFEAWLGVLTHLRWLCHMTLFQEAEARLGVHSHRPVGWPDQREVGGSAGVSIAHTVKSMPNWLFFLWTNEQIKLTGQKNNIAQPNTDKWFSFSLHFSLFLTV